MRRFESNEACFGAVAALATRLDAAGHETAAAELRSGMARIDGLTDGWMEFVRAVEAVERRCGRKLDATDRDELRAIREAARRAVRRR